MRAAVADYIGNGGGAGNIRIYGCRNPCLAAEIRASTDGVDTLSNFVGPLRARSLFEIGTRRIDLSNGKQRYRSPISIGDRTNHTIKRTIESRMGDQGKTCHEPFCNFAVRDIKLR